MASSNPKPWIAQLDEEASLYAGQIVNLIAFPMAMHTAIELGLFEIIAKAEGAGHRISALEIAVQIKALEKDEAADKLDRILRLLGAFSVATSSVEEGGDRRVYGLAPAGRYFVRDEDGASLGPLMSLIHDNVFLSSWSKLKEAILEGGSDPFTKTHGVHAFEYPRLDSRFNDVLNLAMVNHTTIVMKKVLLHYKGFESLEQLVDVGGGLGFTLKTIVAKYPTLRGINFDQPHVIENAPLTQGIEHVGVDMFESVPSPVEAIFMKWILHDWSDEKCVKLLKNCYNAIPKNGKVIVLEHVVVEGSENAVEARAVCQRDVSMTTQCPGGKERTKEEFMALADAAGFTNIQFECHVCNFWIMEFCK